MTHNIHLDYYYPYEKLDHPKDCKLKKANRNLCKTPCLFLSTVFEPMAVNSLVSKKDVQSFSNSLFYLACFFYRGSALQMIKVESDEGTEIATLENAVPLF